MNARPLLLSGVMVILPSLAPPVRAETPLGAAFTYQGQLKQDGAPTNGLFDFRFRLFDAAVAGAPVGASVCADGVDVVNGLFTVPLDFGAQFNNEARFLEIEVRADATAGNCAGGAYTMIAGRQALSAVPYALGVRLPLTERLDSAGSVVSVTNNGTGRVLTATRGGAAGGLSAIRADSTGDAALWGQGTTATAEGVSAISTGGANALNAQAQGATGRAGDFAITNAANPNPALFAATAGTGSAALFDGRVDIGAEGSNTGELLIFAEGSADRQIRAYGDTRGGAVDLFDETGSFHSGFEPDLAGSGGFAYIYRSSTNQGFTVDGNTGANEPRVTISGSARSAAFDMADIGNASVELPTSAIAAAECFDEPGVASAAEGASPVAITSTALTTILARTITAPAAGYVLVLATTQFQIPHVAGTNDTYNLGVSDSSTALPDNQDLLTTVIDDLPTGTYQKAVTAHGLFSVSAGSHTFYFLGEKVGAASVDAIALDVQLTLLYFPTAYGTVTPTLAANAASPGINDDLRAAPKPAMTSADMEQERAESVTANQVRIQQELDEMRIRFDALQEELDAVIREQQAAAAHAVRPAKPVHPITEGH